MEVKVKFNDINVKEEKEKTLVKILMLKGEKGEKGDGDFNVIEDVKVNGTSLPVSGKSVNIEIPTNNSAFNNDSGYLVENDMQMVETSDIQNGSQITDGTGYGRLNKIYGNTLQNGTPTPDNPVDIDVVTGDVEITISNSDNTSSQNYLLSLGDIELCKIGNYQDYIYYEDGKWYIYKNIKKLILNGSENWYIYNNNLYLDSVTDYKRQNNIPFCSHYKGIAMTFGTITPSVENENTIRFGNNTNLSNRLFIIDTDFSNVTSFKNWLSQNNVIVYYILSTPQEIEITNEILINQLEQTLNLYKNETNFTISASNAVPSLNITYSITNRDFYSKDEADSKLNIKVKELKNNEDNISKEIEDMKNTLKFHSVANSSATYVVEFENGKNLLIDTGMSSQWNDIKIAIDNLGITKFDYLILTHFHTDHIGNIQNFIDNYDFSECICWVQMKPDFINHSEEISETKNNYDSVITLLTNNGLNPIVPENDSYFEIDENTKLHFLNTDETIAEDYYNYITEYRTEKVNFNSFSLVTEIMHLEHNIIATGDIEYATEKGITPFIHKANLITTPHHGVNIDAYYGFYDTVMPEYSINSYVSDNDEWVHFWYKSFMYLQEKGCKMVTAAWTTPVNGLFTFISNYKDFYTTVKGEKKYVPTHSRARLLTSIHDLINPTQIKRADLTINDVFNNMNYGDEAYVYWWESYNEVFPTLYSELQALFPQFTNSWSLRLKKGDSYYKRIEVSYQNNLTLSCENYLNNITWPARSGHGLIPDITGQENLINALKDLPIGDYIVSRYIHDGDVLEPSGYVLNISIMGKWIANDEVAMNCSIHGVLRHTGAETRDTARVVDGYINTTNTPQIIWYRFNNYSG